MAETERTQRTPERTPERTLCPGPCNRGHWQAVSDLIARADAWAQALQLWGANPWEPPPDPPDIPIVRPVPIFGEPTWCGPCTATVRRALADLDTLGAVLAAQADGLRGQADEKVSGGGASVPSPSPAADELDQLTRWLIQWEHWYRAQHGWPCPAHAATGVRPLTAVTSWLIEQLSGLLALDTGSDHRFGVDVLRWRRRLQKLTHAEPELVNKPEPCPRCDTRSLQLVAPDNPDERHVVCRNCQRHMAMAEYDKLAQEHANDNTKLKPR